MRSCTKTTCRMSNTCYSTRFKARRTYPQREAHAVAPKQLPRPAWPARRPRIAAEPRPRLGLCAANDASQSRRKKRTQRHGRNNTCKPTMLTRYCLGHVQALRLFVPSHSRHCQKPASHPTTRFYQAPIQCGHYNCQKNENKSIRTISKLFNPTDQICPSLSHYYCQTKSFV